MGNVRIYQLARELNITSKDLLEIIEDLGIEAKNHMSIIDSETAKLISEALGEELDRKEFDVEHYDDEVEEGKNHRKKKSVSSTKKDLDDDPFHGRDHRRHDSRKNAETHQGGPEKAKETSEHKQIELSERIAIQDLAGTLGVTPAQLIKRFLEKGVIVNINQKVDFEIAKKVVEELGFNVTKVDNAGVVNPLQREEDAPEAMEHRPPVVTIMGHVDHGKTTLLDAIRQTNVTAQEAGGITQRIGAYQVTLDGRKITFIDTPGHEAFTAMRARGARVTDIAILVVAADDGVMPQTIEAINHAKAAEVPIIVAINKIDRPSANVDRVKQQLTDHGLIPEEWGGDTICVPLSAIKKEGIEDLLEMILLVAEMAELKANPNGFAKGVIIESELDLGKGPVARALVNRGTLKVGDSVVAGTVKGKVRAMMDHIGNRLISAGPATPVEILGFSEIPTAGEQFVVVTDDRMARQIAAKRLDIVKAEEQAKPRRMTLDELFKSVKEGTVEELNIILKADFQGSLEALRGSLEQLSTDEVKVNIIHTGVGGVTETDITLATASNAIIIGFNVRPEPNAKRLAESENIDMRFYRVIYDVVDDVKAALQGLLKPKEVEVTLGRAEVRDIFKIPKVGNIAGCYVLDGKITRSAKLRLLRDNVVIHEGRVSSLKRFKDDVREVLTGFECGIGIENFNDLKEGDVIEAFIIEGVQRTL